MPHECKFAGHFSFYHLNVGFFLLSVLSKITIKLKSQILKQPVDFGINLVDYRSQVFAIV